MEASSSAIFNQDNSSLIINFFVAVGTLALALLGFLNIKQGNDEKKKRLKGSLSLTVDPNGVITITNSSEGQLEIKEVRQYRLSDNEVKEIYSQQENNLPKYFQPYRTAARKVGSSHRLSSKSSFILENSKTFGSNLEAKSNTYIIYTLVSYREPHKSEIFRREFLHRISSEELHQPNYVWVEIMSK